MKAGREVLFGRCAMAEEYTDAGTSLASGRSRGRQQPSVGTHRAPMKEGMLELQGSDP